MQKVKKPKYIKEILDALESVWGYEKRPNTDLRHEEPLDGLILTLLSQNTNDRNRDRAFASLKGRYPQWEQAANASAADIADAIRVAGLGDTKAARMKQVLQIIKDRFGSYSIKGLADWDTCEAREFLVSLPGIGLKTAACVLVFDLDKPAFPVDTHVARISRRLGWVPEKMQPAKIQEYLESVLPPSRFRGAHLNMIEHGRGICTSRKPDCANCPAKKWCNFCKSLD